MPPDRPRLWESVKRALGGVPTDSPAEREPARDEAPPFLPADEAATVAPAPVSARADEAGALPDGEPDDRPAHPEPVPPAPGIPAPRSPRLARGLASFSRDNADRERKFRHILSDGDSGKKK